MPLPSSSSPAPRFWWCCAVGTLPIAWAIERAGFGIPIAEPVHDLAYLALASIVEEVVFRGGIQRALLRWRRPGSMNGATTAVPCARAVWGISAANALASVLFAAAHAWNHPFVVVVGILPVSLLLGRVYERSGERLLPPIALHLYFNLALFTFSLYRP